jgi:uncharacterized protein (DUF736 family)
MATIGTFYAASNGFTGTIDTLSFKTEVEIEPAQKSSDKGPDFRVFLKNTRSEIGAAWKKTSREGATYLSVRLDDPSFVAPIDCRLVKTGAEKTHSLVWERPRPRS